MTIDNRTNHFTDEQVIAAAMVIDRNAFRVGEAESNAWETGRDFPSELSAAKQRIRTRKYRAKKNARAALVAAAGVAPVQPSSTVDEAALARVVRSALPYDVEVSPVRKSKTERHFRTVADGDLHVERITSAIAEYLTGGTK